jgi:hypothetical protein
MAMHEKCGYKGGGSSASGPKPVKLDQGAAQRACGKDFTKGKDATMSKQSGRSGGYRPK